MPEWKSEIRARLAGLRVAPDRINDIVEELAQHVDDRYAELAGDGMPEADARRAALDELAANHVLGRALRRVAPAPAPTPPVPGEPSREGWLNGLVDDLRDGVRGLRASPGLTLVALITLSIGIGAVTAIFSVVNAAILRPLPFAEPDRLVTFWGSAPAMGLPVVDYPDALLVYVRQRTRTLDRMAGYMVGGFTLTGNGDAERLDGAAVTADFFRVLGRGPAHGRAFLPEEETPGRGGVTILSDGLWKRRFGGTPEIVGKTIRLDERPVTIVGIMPPGFDFPNRVELWLPLPINVQSLNCWCYSTIGRLATGRTPGDTALEMARLNDDFWLEREGKPPKGPASTEPPRSIVIAQSLARRLLGDVKTPLLVLMGAVGMVLLIACANIANLLLARASARGREIAVRCCLGASPWRIVRQLLVESLLLALAGATIGLALAWWGASALGRLAAERLNYVHDATLDPSVLLFAIGVTLATVVLFGVAPALRGARVDLQEVVKDGRRATGRVSSRRLADTFVVAQFALGIVLLVGAGLLLRSFVNLLAVDPGFRPEHVLVGRVSLPWLERPADQNEQQARLFHAQLAERVRTLPGVRSVGLSSSAPFSGGNNQQIFVIEGREPAKDQPQLVASVRSVTPGYFAAVGTPLRGGRVFEETDAENSPLVAVVDETLARRFWPDGGDAPGRRIRLGDGPWRTIVGVVASVKHGDLTAESDRYVYLPHAQAPLAEMDLVVRTAGDPAALTASIRHQIRAMDGSVPFYEVQTLEAAVGRSLATRRLTNNLLLAFAVAAMILAAVGIYGVMAVGVTQRTNEFGIRLALGATPGNLLALVLGQGMRLVVVGVALGLAGAIGITRYLRGLLFQVQPVDPLIFGGVTFVLVAVALGACYIPARRATATDPIEALRCE